MTTRAGRKADEKVEIDGGDGCGTVWIYLMPDNCILTIYLYLNYI